MKNNTLLIPTLCAALIASSPLAFADRDDKIKVMSRNLYLGADIFPVIEVANTDPASVPLAVTAAFQEMQQTNFVERAEAIADEIQRYKPHAIGLQEVSTVYLQSPSDFGHSQYGLPERPADTLYIDYISVLQNALSTRGLNYNVVVTATNADIEVRGAQYRFVNTHLETGGSEPFKSLQAVQMNELLSIMDATNPAATPVILVGDFNSSPTDQPFVSTSGIPGLDGAALVPPYLQAVGTGHIDLWTQKKKARDGFT